MSLIDDKIDPFNLDRFSALDDNLDSDKDKLEKSESTLPENTYHEVSEDEVISEQDNLMGRITRFENLFEEDLFKYSLDDVEKDFKALLENQSY